MTINTVKKITLLGLILFSFLITNLGFAAEDASQKILDLRKQIAELEKQAEQYKNAIGKTQKEGQTLQREINILNNQISRLQTKISITERQITGAKIEIEDLGSEIFDINEDITDKQKTIGEIISIIYQRDNENLVAILLKNAQLSDFFNQVQHNQSLQKKLFAALTELKSVKQDLESKKSNLEEKKVELERLSITQRNKKVSLDGTKVNKNNLLDKTRGQETRYQQLLNEVERKKTEFFSELQDLERQTVKRGEYLLRVSAPIPSRAKIFRWPEDDYVLTQGYGMTSYARRGAYGGAPHNGIDVASGYGTPIKSIGSGKILVSGTNNGWGNWVAVQHDNGLVSAYGHMRTPTGLANGTPVDTGDIIGFEGSTGNSTGSHVHLSLYHEFFTFINPRNGQVYFNYFDGTLNPLDYLQ